MGKIYLGIDLGGTQVKIAIVQSNGSIVEETAINNHKKSVPSELIKKIVTESRKLKMIKKISGVGVGVAGDIDQKNGVVRFSPNMHKWKNVHLSKILKKYFSCPVIIDNDANVAALGAYYLDAKAKIQNLVCVTLGTGVGGGLIINGKVYRGATGTAGEIGHMTLDLSGTKCQCGNIGCIERYVGASGLQSEARKLLVGNKKSKILEFAGGKEKNITPKIIFEAAVAGDKIAKQVWDDAGMRLGVILAGIVNLLNPEMIVLSGGISKAKQLILKPLKRTINQRAFKSSSKACRIIVSGHTSRLGVVGAALLAH